MMQDHPHIPRSQWPPAFKGMEAAASSPAHNEEESTGSAKKTKTTSPFQSPTPSVASKLSTLSTSRSNQDAHFLKKGYWPYNCPVDGCDKRCYVNPKHKPVLDADNFVSDQVVWHAGLSNTANQMRKQYVYKWDTTGRNTTPCDCVWYPTLYAVLLTHSLLVCYPQQQQHVGFSSPD